MSPIFELAVSGTAGLAAGLLSGFLGMGGGALLPPLLAISLSVGQHRAQGISLAALLPPVGLPAVLAYRKMGVHISPKLAALLIIGFVVGVSGGAWLAHRISQDQLRSFFAAFLVLSAVRAATEKPENAAAGRASDESALWMGVPIGALAGLMSGLLGVGGGLVALPLLRKYAGLGRLEAQATTMAMMLPPIGLPAVYVYAKEQGGLPWSLLVAVAIGFSLGTGLGARLSGRVKGRSASLIYAVFLVAMALVLLLRT